VPFGALKDRISGRFVIEDFIVEVAPSATFVMTPSLHKAANINLDDVLLVSPFPADLPESREEIQDLEMLYPRAKAIVGSTIRKADLLEEICQHEVLHYAGHAEVHPSDPFRSRLLLGSANDNESQEVTVKDLQDVACDNLDLVVISACSSTASAPTRTGGFLGLARPFLSGGVRSVVGTLWDVEDSLARAFLVSFHRELLEGESPASALRRVQLRYLELGEPLRNWAAFTVIGKVHSA
jgi:CHAT domain-containing protein